MTTTAPRRAITQPEPVRPPEDWQATFGDPALLEAIASVERLEQGRRTAKETVRETERDLEAAAVRDRDALATAIAAGTKAPASDQHAKRAGEALAEAQRQLAAHREAHARATRDLVRTIRERRDAVLADLSARRASAARDVDAALASLTAAVSTCDRFVQTDGQKRGGNSAPALARIAAEVHEMIGHPVASVSVDDASDAWGRGSP
jgi:hypothetical protein